jgi:hypothetical protein
MIDPFERTIRRTLRQLAKQRVRMILQPGNFWVIDNARVAGVERKSLPPIWSFNGAILKPTMAYFELPQLSNRHPVV